MEFSDDDFIEVKKGWYAEVAPDVVRVTRSSIVMGADVGDKLALESDPRKALVDIAYSTHRQALRLRKGDSGYDYIFTRLGSSPNMRLSAIPPSLQRAKVVPGNYKLLEGSEDIFLYDSALDGEAIEDKKEEESEIDREEKYYDEKVTFEAGDIVSWLLDTKHKERDGSGAGSYKRYMVNGVIDHMGMPGDTPEEQMLVVRPISKRYKEANPHAYKINLRARNVVLREKRNGN